MAVVSERGLATNGQKSEGANHIKVEAKSPGDRSVSRFRRARMAKRALLQHAWLSWPAQLEAVLR